MEIKLVIDGTEYKMNQLDYTTGASSTPSLLFAGKKWVGEAVANKQKRDWEILSFLDRDNEVIQSIGNDIFKHPVTGTYDLDFLLKNNYPIHSVKRSDGEVFSLADKIDGLSYKDRFLKEFYIADNSMRVIQTGGESDLKNISKAKMPLLITEEGIKIYEPTDFVYMAQLNTTTGGYFKSFGRARVVSCLQNAKFFHSEINRDWWIKENSPKVPLFTTEDGVEIFIHTKVWYLNGLWQIDTHDFDEQGEPFYPEIYKYFSTEEKANEYILFHKPISISYSDFCRSLPEVPKFKVKDIRHIFESKIHS